MAEYPTTHTQSMSHRNRNSPPPAWQLSHEDQYPMNERDRPHRDHGAPAPFESEPLGDSSPDRKCSEDDGDPRYHIFRPGHRYPRAG